MSATYNVNSSCIEAFYFGKAEELRHYNNYLKYTDSFDNLRQGFMPRSFVLQRVSVSSR